MKKNSRKKELYNLSGQFMDLFISDILTKNKVNVSEAKEKITDEQRKKIKETVENLKSEVEDYLDSNSKKTVTEEDQDNKTDSPLREKIRKRKESKEKGTKLESQKDINTTKNDKNNEKK